MLENVGLVYEHLRTTALYDSIRNAVIIILRIPIVSDMVFNTFENLIIPSHIKGQLVAITNINKYLIVSSDKELYVLRDHLECKDYSSFYLCDPMILRDILFESCEENGFRMTTPNDQYRCRSFQRS